MTIKKTVKVVRPTEVTETPAPVGGATIADRFKLDMTNPAESKKPAGKAATIAAVAGLIALAVAGILTFIIYQHWEFLRAA